MCGCGVMVMASFHIGLGLDSGPYHWCYATNDSGQVVHKTLRAILCSNRTEKVIENA